MNESNRLESQLLKQIFVNNEYPYILLVYSSIHRIAKKHTQEGRVDSVYKELTENFLVDDSQKECLCDADHSAMARGYEVTFECDSNDVDLNQPGGANKIRRHRATYLFDGFPCCSHYRSRHAPALRSSVPERLEEHASSGNLLSKFNIN